MNREDLIYKWLNHELTADELDAFKQFDDYDALIKLNTATQGFKASNFDASNELQLVLDRIESKKSKKLKWLPIAMSVAAVFVLCFGLYFYDTTTDSTYNTLTAQKQTIQLPDASTVTLNAMSELSYNTTNWDNNRTINLDGEAFFKVAKGSKFQVKTTDGIVTVLGTQFNIKQRNNYFEVVCYEGLVNVTSDTFDVNLSPENRFLMRDGKLIATEKETSSAPSWIDNYSRFKSTPYKIVLAEFERQYDLKIDLKSVDDSQLFTGSFTHDDLETALKSITLPLQLTYSKTNRTITLKRE
ncbi:MAG: FecR family protein [Aquaticitalea sp.]